MAKELMEIGGFITEGAEIVNHDASLSGNGTVDSPLGLNETVLWSGSEIIANDLELILSENLDNFERIKIYGEGWSNWCPVLWGEIITASNGTNKQASLVTSYLGASGAAVRFVQMMFNLSTNKITISNVGLFSLQGTAVTSGTPTNTVIRKIVGINRIANN